MKLLLFLILIISSCSIYPGKKNERYYQTRWCKARKGKIEVSVSEGDRKYRVDCVTRHYAIEFDYAGKWEALEQALQYGRLTKKRPGIVFICKSPKDKEKITRTLRNIRFYKLPVRVWRENC